MGLLLAFCSAANLYCWEHENKQLLNLIQLRPLYVNHSFLQIQYVALQDTGHPLPHCRFPKKHCCILTEKPRN